MGKRIFYFAFNLCDYFFVIAQCLDKLDLSIPFFDFRVFTVLTLLEAIAYYDCNCRGIIRLNNEILALTSE